MLTVAVLLATVILVPGVARAAGPPQIINSWALEFTEAAADLQAKINPNGPSTTYRFEYVTQAAFEASGYAKALKVPPSDALLGSGTTPLQTFQSQITSLSSTTVYRYRVVASNIEGSTTSPERTFTTRETGHAFQLPDDRGWEMVSPVDKNGGAIAAPGELFGGGDIQAASDPAVPVVTFGSATSFGDASGAPPVSQYVSRRSASGWTTENVSSPLDSAAYGDEPDGAPYRLFSTDLSRALLFGGLPCRGGFGVCPAPNQPLPGSGAPFGYMAYYMRDNAHGTFSSLLGAANLGFSAVSAQNFEVAFAATSPDLSHVVLSSCAALTEDAIEVPDGPGRCDPESPNLYEWSSSGLKLVNPLPGAEIAAPSGAVSTDGSRIYWTGGGDLHLREGAQAFQIDETQGGGGAFQTATPDGSIAFFTKAAHLYRFVAATKTASDLTPAGGVVGVLGASADGNYVYYLDAAGLELWHGGIVTTLAPGADAVAASDYPPATATARVSADGTHLAFLSTAKLTAYDNTNVETGQPYTELYLYGPPPGGGAPGIVCASCNPAGERALGPSTIPGAQVNGTTLSYKTRVLSANGTRLLFDSEDKLARQDTNSQPDVYEWEWGGTGDCRRTPGCVSLISSGREGEGGATLLDATADGSDVFFLTKESLISDDPGSIDLYDARVGGGFPAREEEEICVGDSCQPLPAPPEDPSPGTLVRAPGNPRQHFFVKRKKHKHKKRHRNRKHHSHGKFHVVLKRGERPGSERR